MAVTEIQAKEFDEKALNSEKMALVEFWHDKCHWCHKFGPIYEQVSEKFPDVSFLKMNALENSENQDLAAGKGVISTPTTKAFCKGVEVGEIIGFRDAEELEKAIKDLIEGVSACEQSTKLQN